MRPRSFHLPPFAAALLLLATTGCNYVHFGRLDARKGDPALAAENSDLRMEKKLLQQELSIARKEQDALRIALDRPGSSAESADLVTKLNEATRELATLRASHARLQADRERLQKTPVATGSALATASELADVKTRLTTTEDKLAEALRTYTQLQEDNARLRTEIDQAHAENTSLTQKLAQTSAQNNEARAALAQLNTEFLAQKEARAQAEQATEALRAQLHAITSQNNDAAPVSLASARETSATGVREIETSLHVAGISSASTAAASLSTNPDKLHLTPLPPPPPLVVKPARTYVVRTGDTLEKISEQFYGRRDRWSLLYAANNSQLSGGRPLKPGMELEIPNE